MKQDVMRFLDFQGQQYLPGLGIQKLAIFWFALLSYKTEEAMEYIMQQCVSLSGIIKYVLQL